MWPRFLNSLTHTHTPCLPKERLTTHHCIMCDITDQFPPLHPIVYIENIFI